MFLLAYFKFSKYRAENTFLHTLLADKDTLIQELKAEISVFKEEATALKISQARLDTELKEEKRHLTDKINELKQVRDEFGKQFKAISNEILNLQREEVAKTQTSNLDAILKPFKDKIDEFQKQVANAHEASLKGNAGLDVHLRNLQEMNSSLTKEAANLAEALQGKKKLQGNWGEMQIESLFETIGFTEGREFSRQEVFKAEDGRKIPDFILNLPGERRVIIDAKVSLVDYLLYVDETGNDEATRALHLKNHINAIKRHIEELSKKEYHRLIKESSLDYVFMFMPTERAYLEALNKDPTLYDFAYKKGIAITTPSSLFPILRTIDTLWKIERQNKSVMEIADMGRKLYEKMHGFITDFKKIKGHIDNAGGSYDEALKKLAYGQGNAISIMNRMKEKGGWRTNKEFSIEAYEGGAGEAEGSELTDGQGTPLLEAP